MPARQFPENCTTHSRICKPSLRCLIQRATFAKAAKKCANKVRNPIQESRETHFVEFWSFHLWRFRGSICCFSVARILLGGAWVFNRRLIVFLLLFAEWFWIGLGWGATDHRTIWFEYIVPRLAGWIALALPYYALLSFVVCHLALYFWPLKRDQPWGGGGVLVVDICRGSIGGVGPRFWFTQKSECSMAWLLTLTSINLAICDLPPFGAHRAVA